jgi:hypothetical protein
MVPMCWASLRRRHSHDCDSELHRAGASNAEIARRLPTGRISVRRIIKERIR